jgi:hypothetical protein
MLLVFVASRRGTKILASINPKVPAVVFALMAH